jgi:hypothetical protein
MVHAVNAVQDFVMAIYELIAGFFTTLYNLISTVIMTIVNFFANILHLIVSTIQGTFNIAGESAKFLLGEYLFGSSKFNDTDSLAGNAVLIGIVAVGGYAYVRYQSSQGKPVVVGNKKLN